MLLAITLIHNKTNAQNTSQITALRNMVTMVPSGDGMFHHTINTLTGHTAKIYQIVPTGTTPPASRYGINSGGIVEYMDVGRTGTHPAFINWAIKKGITNGADVSVYLTDPSLMTAVLLQAALNKFVNNVVLVEESWGKLISKRGYEEVGLFNESMTFANALADYKSRITARGLAYG